LFGVVVFVLDIDISTLLLVFIFVFKVIAVVVVSKLVCQKNNDGLLLLFGVLHEIVVI